MRHQDEWNCVTEWVQPVMGDRIWLVIHMAAETNNKKKHPVQSPRIFISNTSAQHSLMSLLASVVMDCAVCHHLCNWTLDIISGHMQPSAFFQTQDSLKDYRLSSVISGLELYLLKSLKGVWLYLRSHQLHLFFFCHLFTLCNSTGSANPQPWICLSWQIGELTRCLCHLLNDAPKS